MRPAIRVALPAAGALLAVVSLVVAVAVLRTYVQHGLWLGGLTVVVLDNGRSYHHQMPETTCGGVALLDFDGDGWMDVFAVQGGEFPPPQGSDQPGDRDQRMNRGMEMLQKFAAGVGCSVR